MLLTSQRSKPVCVKLPSRKHVLSKPENPLKCHKMLITNFQKCQAISETSA